MCRVYGRLLGMLDFRFNLRINGKLRGSAEGGEGEDVDLVAVIHCI